MRFFFFLSLFFSGLLRAASVEKTESLGKSSKTTDSVFSEGIRSTKNGSSRLKLDLDQIERDTLDRSPQLAAARQAAQSVLFQSEAQRSRRMPMVSLEASYKHLSEVPSIRASPASPALEMGDNTNYAYGPVIRWLAWDSGASYRSARAVTHQRFAKDQDVRATVLQLRLALRLKFFQVHGSAEQLRWLADALALARAQRDDVAARAKAGVASRQDWLQAEGDVLTRRQEFREAQTSFASHLRDILSLMGADDGVDLSAPFPESWGGAFPEGLGSPTVLVSLSSTETWRQKFASAAQLPFNLTRPDLLSLREQATSAKELARSVRAGHGPSIQLVARTSREYPNGPIHQEIRQNSYGGTVFWSLFEGDRVKRESQSYESLALSLENRRRQAEEDLHRDWQRAHEQLAGLWEQERLARESVKVRTTLAALTYDSYGLGRTTFLEVQAANLGLLQAQVQCVKTEVAILSQLALLSSLSHEEP